MITCRCSRSSLPSGGQMGHLFATCAFDLCVAACSVSGNGTEKSFDPSTKALLTGNVRRSEVGTLMIPDHDAAVTFFLVKVDDNGRGTERRVLKSNSQQILILDPGLYGLDASCFEINGRMCRRIPLETEEIHEPERSNFFGLMRLNAGDIVSFGEVRMDATMLRRWPVFYTSRKTDDVRTFLAGKYPGMEERMQERDWFVGHRVVGVVDCFRD